MIRFGVLYRMFALGLQESCSFWDSLRMAFTMERWTRKNPDTCRMIVKACEELAQETRTESGPSE